MVIIEDEEAPPLLLITIDEVPTVPTRPEPMAALMAARREAIWRESPSAEALGYVREVRS